MPRHPRVRASGLLGWNRKLRQDGESAEPSVKCDTVSSRRPCWSKEIRFRVPCHQREPCIAKAGKQSLSKNRNCDTGPDGP